VSRRAQVLEARRDLLVARSAYLRADLQCGAVAIGQRARLVDRATAFARSGSGRAVIAGGAVLLVLSGPRRLLHVVGRALTLWPLVRSVASMMKSGAGVR
jgi:hypothetical protein